MPEIVLDEITEVTMEIQNGSENVDFEVSSTNPTVALRPTDSVVVRTIDDYGRLRNKPKINNKILNPGDNPFPYLGLGIANTVDIDLLFYRGG